MLLESKETFQVYMQEANSDDASERWGTALHSIEAVRARVKKLRKAYIGAKVTVTRLTVIVEEINPDTFG